MAQTNISNFFAVRRKRTDGHGSLKRRKLADGTREDIIRGDDGMAMQSETISKTVTPIASVAPTAVWKSPTRPQCKSSEFSPQLQKFKSFEIESPTKKPRYNNIYWERIVIVHI